MKISSSSSVINKIFIITGQTATGKTDLATQYAVKYDGEIVSADSRQIYRGLDIVTGKDTAKYIETGIAVYGIDICDPRTRFSSHDFVSYAHKVIQNMFTRRKSVIIAGGTYLYIKHLLYGFDVAVPPDADLRKSLESKSLSELQKIVGKDHGMNESDFHNPRRLIRKIEIQSAAPNGVDNPNSAPFLTDVQEFIGLRHASNVQLENAITKRVDDRLNAGAVEEVKQLLSAGYTGADPGLSGIGYPQILKYLSGNSSLEQTRQEWITKEVQYAKRQYTFMKKDALISWSVI